jgi:vitamin B12 transporter
MKALCFFLVLFFAAMIPLAAQEDYDGDDFFDEWLIMEGVGLTILGSIPTTQQMETVNRETIERINAPDIPSLLQEALGLGITRYGPYGNMANVNLRGFNTRRVAVLVDGIPANSTRSGDFDFYSINPLSIESIEVIHGGSDTKYNVSGAIGGVINIITIRNPNPGWTFGGSFSNSSYLPGNYRTRAGLTGDPQWQDLADSQNISILGSYGAELYSLNISVFGNRAGNHFLYTDPFNFTRRKEGNEVLDAGVSISFLHDIGDFSKLIASAMFYFGDKNIPVSGYASAYGEQRDLSSSLNLMLDTPRAFHDNFSMEFVLGHDWKRLTYNRDVSRHDEHSVSIINRWGWHPASAFTLRFGGDYRFVNIDSTNTGIRYANRGGLYLTSEYSPQRNFLFIASIKGVGDGREIAPIPKLGWSWLINENFTLRNNYFRSFKFPDFDDLYWVQQGFMGNPDLNNEDGWGADLGAEFSFEHFNINSVFYGQWINDSIHWTNVSGSWRPQNSGTAAFLGWDNKVNLILPVSFWILEKPVFSFSWLFQLSWLLSGALSFNDNMRIPYMPMHTIGLSLELPWLAFRNKLPGSLIISGHFESLRYADTRNAVILDSVFLLNFIYNQRMNENTGIFARINNALNASYVSFAGYPMPGISVTLGMNMHFNSAGSRL